MIPSQALVTLTDPSGVAEARHRAGTFAAALDFDATTAGQLALAATEAAGNMVKHGGGGRLLMKTINGGDALGVEVLALDQGSGMRTWPRACATAFPPPAARAPGSARSRA